jgi:phosphoribosyl-AMP cyclohydrolase
MDAEALDWTKLRSVADVSDEVLPVAVQDADSGDVLMIGYVNRRALAESIRSGTAVFWSTSRDELHPKGATSGDVLELLEVRINWEANSLLYRVRLLGEGACHTRDASGRARRTCFYRPLGEAGSAGSAPSS